jgi:hypothetical protein
MATLVPWLFHTAAAAAGLAIPDQDQQEVDPCGLTDAGPLAKFGQTDKSDDAGISTAAT